MHIIATFSDKGLQQFITKLEGAGQRIRPELASGLNKAGNQIFHDVQQALFAQMGTKSFSPIERATDTIPASSGSLTFTIIGQGSGLKIEEFPVSAAVHAPVTAMPWALSHTFKRSFMTSARGLLRARTTSKRLPIRSLRGPAPAKEIIKDKSLAAFESGVAGRLEPMVQRALTKLVG